MGRLLVHDRTDGTVAGRVVEVEAYHHRRDPASHAYRGETPRNRVMFGPAGHAYVYFTYGMHYCLNVVAEREGVAAAVLIRALEPVHGVDLMARRRAISDPTRLARGPGCVAAALGVGREENGLDLTRGALWISDQPPRRGRFRVARGARIGIRHGLELPWRFFLAGHPCVSATRGSAHPVESRAVSPARFAGRVHR
jgi:DNA-3-methyladenine glycosylase